MLLLLLPPPMVRLWPAAALLSLLLVLGGSRGGVCVPLRHVTVAVVAAVLQGCDLQLLPDPGAHGALWGAGPLLQAAVKLCSEGILQLLLLVLR